MSLEPPPILLFAPLHAARHRLRFIFAADVSDCAAMHAEADYCHALPLIPFSLSMPLMMFSLSYAFSRQPPPYCTLRPRRRYLRHAATCARYFRLSRRHAIDYCRHCDTPPPFFVAAAADFRSRAFRAADFFRLRFRYRWIFRPSPRAAAAVGDAERCDDFYFAATASLMPHSPRRAIMPRAVILKDTMLMPLDIYCARAMNGTTTTRRAATRNHKHYSTLRASAMLRATSFCAQRHIVYTAAAIRRAIAPLYGVTNARRHAHGV